MKLPSVTPSIIKRIVKKLTHINNKKQTHPIIMPVGYNFKSHFGLMIENVYKVTINELIILISKAY
jgi:hypothetical protein